MVRALFKKEIEIKYMSSTVKYQNDGTECGVWALFYIYLRHLGYDAEEILKGPEGDEKDPKKNWTVPFRAKNRDGWELVPWENAISNDKSWKKRRREIFFSKA